MNALYIFCSTLIAIVLILYYATTKKFNYWRRKKVPYAKPVPLFGNYAEYILLKKCSSKVMQELCQKFPGEPYFGTFFGTEPALVIQDPEIIKLVFKKDFYYFNSRELMEFTTREVITQNLFFHHGDVWKVLRQNLTPLFTAAKMKNMFHLVKKCADQLESLLDHETESSEVLEIDKLMVRYAMDSICSCSFGIEVGTLEKDAESNPFLVMGELIFSSSFYRGLKTVTRAMWPRIFYGLGFKTFPTSIDNFFHKLLIGVYENRGYEPTERHDFIDLLLNLKKSKYLVGDSMSNLKLGGSKKTELEVNDDLLVSQSVVFFAAGFETSAGTLSLTVFEMAKNKEVQRRAQKEVDEYLRRNNNKLSYDSLSELPYLEACLNETLRIYPFVGIITREVVEDYTFPSGLQLEKGTRVHLPVYHLHRDPNNFPNPEQYNPERFLPDAQGKVNPCMYFPFGEGPRTCIGMRFGKMQVIAGLVTFLKKFHVELAEGTPETLDFKPTAPLLRPTCGINVRIHLREGWEDRVYA